MIPKEQKMTSDQVRLKNSKNATETGILIREISL